MSTEIYNDFPHPASYGLGEESNRPRLMSTGKPSSYLLAQCPRSVNRDVMAQGLYLMQELNLHRAVLILNR